MNTDTHAAWVNSEALVRGGIAASSPDPWDGYIVRDPDGSPSGCLQEGAAYSFWAGVVPRDPLPDWMASIKVAQHSLHALGVTGWQDAWVEPDLLRAYRAVDDEGGLTARVVTALWWDRHRGPEQIDDLLEERVVGQRRQRPRDDGQDHARRLSRELHRVVARSVRRRLRPAITARGIQFVGAEELRDAVTRLDALGFQVHQHALGDRAVRGALDAVETARRANGMNDLRHHIAHLQLPDPADVPRLRQLGVIANIQPFWAQPDPMTETMTKPRVGARATRLYPIGDLVRSGAVLCLGSDWPVSTPNPFLEMEVAVTRRAVGDPDGEPLDAAQRIDLQTAIAAFTRGSAYVNHDDEAGSIEEGKRADLVVLDRNPFDGPPHEIGTTAVTATVAAGRVVYERV